MLKTDEFKTRCKGDSHSSKTANIILPRLMIKQRWTPLPTPKPTAGVRCTISQIAYGGRARRAHHKTCQPFFDLITGRMPQSGKLPVLNLLTCQNVRFFAPQVRFVARIHVKLGMADWHQGPLLVYNFTPIGAGDGSAAPKYRTFPLFGK